MLVATTEIENERSGQFRAGEEVVFSFTFDNVLAPGRYRPVFQLTHRGSGLDVIDRFEGSFSFVVTGRRRARRSRRPARAVRDQPRTGDGHAERTRHERAGASADAPSEPTPFPTRRSGGRSAGRARSPAIGGGSGT